MNLRKTAGIIVFSVLLILSFSNKMSFGEIATDKKFSMGAGPMSIRNQMPLYLIFLQMAPENAGVREHKKFEINADYTVSNITVSAFTPATSLYDIQIDLEVSRITIDFRYGLYNNLEIGLELPYISLSSGYLDGPIESIEDVIDARTPRSRERQGSYEFDYTFKYNNQFLIYQKHSVEGLGDIVLNSKYHLLKERSWFLPNISLRAAVKFPTAEKNDLLGSGEIDYGIGLLLDKCFFGRAFVYAGANAVMIEKPSFFSALGLEEQIFSGMLAIEYLFTKRFSLVTQVTGNTTPYPFTDTNPLDNEAYELGIGLNYAFKKDTDLLYHFGITENISAASSPDVSLHTGLKWRF